MVDCQAPVSRETTAVLATDTIGELERATDRSQNAKRWEQFWQSRFSSTIRSDTSKQQTRDCGKMIGPGAVGGNATAKRPGEEKFGILTKLTLLSDRETR
jgi:chitodextrinase